MEYGFVDRHIGPSDREIEKMLEHLNLESLEHLIERAVPETIRLRSEFRLDPPMTESQALEKLRSIVDKNQVFRSLIGMGYADCIVPPVIQRNVLENPGWYTQYTPYQSEISQGRLEALVNFQSIISDLTGLPIANASLLDEATAAAEAMFLCYSLRQKDRNAIFVVSDDCYEQTLAVVKTRAKPLDITVRIQKVDTIDFSDKPFGILLQYPTRFGTFYDYAALTKRAAESGAKVVVAADPLSLTLLKPPGEWGADVAVGNCQRLGVPLGFGGPHAAYFATKDEHKRKIPGRIIGVSKDTQERPAFRMALQTREQHIRRDKATSNICTSQVLLAIMTSMYAVYHGPAGLTAISRRIHRFASACGAGLRQLGYDIAGGSIFDTVRVSLGKRDAAELIRRSADAGFNFNFVDNQNVCIAFDERTTFDELAAVLGVFNVGGQPLDVASLVEGAVTRIDPSLTRESSFLDHPVFHNHRSETKMLRYIRCLEARDLSLTSSMIPLGSCTMKLNATSELLPVSWSKINSLHPFAPHAQTVGYHEIFRLLEDQLKACTGFDAVSLQPNSGAQGEYAGLLAIRAFHEENGDTERDICLIPKSAHGTNPASATLAGMKVVVIDCDSEGNIDVEDLKTKSATYKDRLAGLMITYPSTHGVFEEAVSQICEIVHTHGGQVYMDGANMNAQIGLAKPAEYGPDVCHLNLHKTFCIPHGGGGPGMGPIAVKKHLAKFLPNHPLVDMPGTSHETSFGTISAAPWGSPSILPISLMYIWMMGAAGLKKASQVAILNANYVANRLSQHYPVLYRGANGLIAHECILDIRPIKAKTGIDVEDIAKRLMDYGFHAPTISFPVPGTMMVEPTESEDLGELDRFCEAMIGIRAEAQKVEDGLLPKEDNPIKNAPHTASVATAETWSHPYSREDAVFPTAATRKNKFWPSVSRIDNAFGDRNLFCTCIPPE